MRFQPVVAKLFWYCIRFENIPISLTVIPVAQMFGAARSKILQNAEQSIDNTNTHVHDEMLPIAMSVANPVCSHTPSHSNADCHAKSSISYPSPTESVNDREEVCCVCLLDQWVIESLPFVPHGKPWPPPQNKTDIYCTCVRRPPRDLINETSGEAKQPGPINGTYDQVEIWHAEIEPLLQDDDGYWNVPLSLEVSEVTAEMDSIAMLNRIVSRRTFLWGQSPGDYLRYGTVQIDPGIFCAYIDLLLWVDRRMRIITPPALGKHLAKRMVATRALEFLGEIIAPPQFGLWTPHLPETPHPDFGPHPALPPPGQLYLRQMYQVLPYATDGQIMWLPHPVRPRYRPYPNLQTYNLGPITYEAAQVWHSDHNAAPAPYDQEEQARQARREEERRRALEPAPNYAAPLTEDGHIDAAWRQEVARVRNETPAYRMPLTGQGSINATWMPMYWINIGPPVEDAVLPQAIWDPTAHVREAPFPPRPDHEPYEGPVELACVVCYDAEISVKLLPCGHSSICMWCSQQLTRCPECRAPIQRREEVTSHPPPHESSTTLGSLEITSADERRAAQLMEDIYDDEIWGDEPHLEHLSQEERDQYYYDLDYDDYVEGKDDEAEQLNATERALIGALIHCPPTLRPREGTVPSLAPNYQPFAAAIYDSQNTHALTIETEMSGLCSRYVRHLLERRDPQSNLTVRDLVRYCLQHDFPFIVATGTDENSGHPLATHEHHFSTTLPNLTWLLISSAPTRQNRSNVTHVSLVTCEGVNLPILCSTMLGSTHIKRLVHAAQVVVQAYDDNGVQWLDGARIEEIEEMPMPVSSGASASTPILVQPQQGPPPPLHP